MVDSFCKMQPSIVRKGIGSPEFQSLSGKPVRGSRVRSATS
jgi:hypothetical protein